ncbi:kinase-like protein [Hypoxylon fragiforme]|uniref:kinase-like protein n=1 Tax=Hypoxylon fragiforme TaxID=63214 RepID=UPI0020C631EE|nr:kinase-like protein [Hypoxylon fragiforme]KAI2612488.1 kinase-like protein [Hypoxylon fragiforme]
MPGANLPSTGRIPAKDEMANATSLSPSQHVYLLADERTIIKSGPHTRAAEAAAMDFVRQHTSIPVPSVYSVDRDALTGHVRIAMEYIPGDPLDRAWAHFTAEEKLSVASQLRAHFDALRQIEASSSFIGSVDGSACADPYFAHAPGAYGPYGSEAEFNSGLLEAWEARHYHNDDDADDDDEDPFAPIFRDALRRTMRGNRIVMTHNNFDPSHVLVRGAKVVAILDWEQAGFYPEYWEYCRALWRPDWDSDWMKDKAVDSILSPYLKELGVIWNTSSVSW